MTLRDALVDILLDAEASHISGPADIILAALEGEP